MTDDEEEEPHVEVVLTMPTSSEADSIQPTAPATIDKQGQSDDANAMEWEHTPATSHPSLPDPTSSSPSALSGVSASSSPNRGDVSMSSDGEGENAPPPIRNLPRRGRDRSVSTQLTSVSPPSAQKQPESAADVIARMKREMGLVTKGKDEEDEDEDEDDDDAAKVLAAALAEDSSDNDEEMQLGPIGKRASGIGRYVLNLPRSVSSLLLFLYLTLTRWTASQKEQSVFVQTGPSDLASLQLLIPFLRPVRQISVRT